MKPELFDMGRKAPDGSAFILFDQEYKENPRFEISEDEYWMIHYWQYWRGNMDRPAQMPESGGLMDQCAIMIEAFSVMDSTHAQLIKQKH